jgi:hypothetical protein
MKEIFKKQIKTLETEKKTTKDHKLPNLVSQVIWMKLWRLTNAMIIIQSYQMDFYKKVFPKQTKVWPAIQ